ncbi:MAG: Npt1/Npt2 family nucleotide transporter [Myxococcota bacterium]
MSSETAESHRSSHPLRDIFWPVYGQEHRKFLPIALINTLILANYTIVRSIKDASIITVSGVETITFIKFWLVVPASFLFFLFYTKVVNVVSRDRLFYGIVVAFLAFFVLFAWVLYPNRGLLHPTASADWMRGVMPAADWAGSVVDIYRYWTLSLFYVVAELWSSVMLSFLFWQFANSVTSVLEAKRFYTHFYLLAHMSVFFAGTFVHSVTSRPAPNDGSDSWGALLQVLLAIVSVNCVVILATYWGMQRFVFQNKQTQGSAQTNPGAKTKPKMSLMQSMRFILSSRYLALIAVLVLSYGVGTNLVEILWKNQLKLQYPDPRDYASFMGLLYMIVGLGTCIVILIGGSVLRRLGWKKAALTTPVVLGGGGLLFCLAIIFRRHIEWVGEVIGITPLMLIVVLGTVQYVLGKSTKYALFDPTKEMTYIPLDEESKTKGKAAIDVFGTRFGKSFGGFLQQILFICVGPVGVIAPYSFCILAVVTAVWIWAVIQLHKRFVALSGHAC